MRPNGTAIRDIRKGQNLGLRALARTTGINRSHLSRIERGLVLHPTSRTLSRIAAALKVPVDAITYEGDDVTRPEPPPTPATLELAPLDPLKRYTPEEVAELGYLPWTPRYIREKCYKRAIYFHRDGGKITFTAEDILRNAQAGAVEPFIAPATSHSAA